AVKGWDHHRSMAASGSVVELRNSRARTAAQHLQAAVSCIAACVLEADGPELGELLIQIREVGVDPLEAAFATGVRRFDRSGEYAADGALSVVAWLKWKCKLSGGAAAERVEIGKQLERLPKTGEAFARGRPRLPARRGHRSDRRERRRRSGANRRTQPPQSRAVDGPRPVHDGRQELRTSRGCRGGAGRGEPRVPAPLPACRRSAGWGRPDRRPA